MRYYALQGLCCIYIVALLLWCLYSFQLNADTAESQTKAHLYSIIHVHVHDTYGISAAVVLCYFVSLVSPGEISTHNIFRESGLPLRHADSSKLCMELEHSCVQIYVHPCIILQGQVEKKQLYI